MKVFRSERSWDLKDIQEKGFVIQEPYEFESMPLGKGIYFEKEPKKEYGHEDVEIELPDDIKICDLEQENPLKEDFSEISEYSDFIDEEMENISNELGSMSRIFHIKKYLEEIGANTYDHLIYRFSNHFKGEPNKAQKVGREIAKRIEWEDVSDHILHKYNKVTTDLSRKFIKAGCQAVKSANNFVVLDQSILDKIHREGKIKKL